MAKLSHLVIFLFIFSFPLKIFTCNVAEQEAFYAISSLKYFLEKEIKKENELFTQEDIQSLWSLAEQSMLPEVLFAKEYYDCKDYLESQYFLTDAWKKLNPYLYSKNETIPKGQDFHRFLLPENSELWKILADIFSDPHVTDNPSNFEKGGFSLISERPSGLFVARHPKLPGYVIKAYILSLKDKKDWQWCIYRCWGVTNVRDLINEKKLKHFVVPDKWIYPFHFKEIKEDLMAMQTPAVLVATDMQLIGRKASRAAWKTRPNYRHIQELYCILSHGYSSCSLPSNMPYTVHGKCACIDTEHPYRIHPYDHVARHLSEEMGDYFNYLVRTGGRGMPY